MLRIQNKNLYGSFSTFCVQIGLCYQRKISSVSEFFRMFKDSLCREWFTKRDLILVVPWCQLYLKTKAVFNEPKCIRPTLDNAFCLCVLKRALEWDWKDRIWRKPFLQTIPIPGSFFTFCLKGYFLNSQQPMIVCEVSWLIFDNVRLYHVHHVP